MLWADGGQSGAWSRSLGISGKAVFDGVWRYADIVKEIYGVWCCCRVMHRKLLLYYGGAVKFFLLF